MNKNTIGLIGRLGGALLLAVFLAGGCAKMKQEKQEKALRQRYTQMVTAACQGNYTNWVECLAPESRSSEGKLKLVWGGMRLVQGVAKKNPDDFRIDSVYFDPAFTNATVNTSHQSSGEWKKDDKPQQWVRIGEVWHLKL